jgi:hypothetical protein
MLGVFTWIRQQMRDAVLKGFADAIVLLTDTDDPAGVLLEYRQDPPHLPLPEEEKVEPEPSGNGRRKVKV